MTTRVLPVDAVMPERETVREAAQVIRCGGLVAFPTETVYGLGADALNPEAVAQIYEAKGRPSDNPLIAHVLDRTGAERLVTHIPDAATQLMDAFWPGPLTLILPKRAFVPNITSGGLQTLAVRCPSHPVARLLIELAGTPIAAPSANASGRPSPTRASHVQFDMDGKIDMILDGGAAVYGLESTIVDVSHGTPRILRPGSVTQDDLELALGAPVIGMASEAAAADEAPLAPGMKYKHYAPSASVVIVSGALERVVEAINTCAADANGKTIGILATEQTKDLYPLGRVFVMGDRTRPETIAANLFKMLRQCDYTHMDIVYAEPFGETQIGQAVMNRLQKAAGYHIIEV